MKTAIMLITHGTPRSEGNDAAVINREPLKELTGLEVYIGYLHMEPSIDATLSKMMADGVERIIAVPLFMFPGLLSDTTVREAFGFEPKTASGRIERNGKTAEVVFTGTFGDHPLIEDVIMKVCEKCKAAPEKTSLMLIFHGTKAPETTAKYVDACIGYLTKKGYNAIAAYNEFQSPDVDAAAEELIKAGKNVLAIPMFVSPGKHTTMDIPPKLGLDGARTRQIGNGHRLCYAKEIGMHPCISRILKARIDEL
ncbi:cobalamin biosynthesis protein CbiX [methanogenic archaeon mixed culture ISO4-G1]|nr:cobalamin biosynthesis protein CbiX [methanogenic archaeon mixed culture ISO4-G1]